jgi:hypothetical protein
MNFEFEDEVELEDEATELQPFFAPRKTMWQMEGVGERQREELEDRLQNTPVGRLLAKMGAKIIIMKPLPKHPLAWVRGQSGFEVDCGSGQPQTNVVFGIYDQDRNSPTAAPGEALAFYLFSSTVDPKTRLACKKSGISPVAREPFAVHSGPGTALPTFQTKIGVDQLVNDAKSPSATLSMDTTTDPDHIECVVRLDTKSNGRVHLTFALRHVSDPTRANVDIPGKLFFLEFGDFDLDKFQTIKGPRGKAVMKAISNF